MTNLGQNWVIVFKWDLWPRGLVKFTGLSETHKEGSGQKQGQGIAQTLSVLLPLKRTQPEVHTLICQAPTPRDSANEYPRALTPCLYSSRW